MVMNFAPRCASEMVIFTKHFVLSNDAAGDAVSDEYSNLSPPMNNFGNSALGITISGPAFISGDAARGTLGSGAS
eukprot:10667977-Ditylum_brightwellii.AAC.1